MQIKNKTKKTIVSKTAEDCKSEFSKASGLMFSKQKDLIFYFKKEKISPLHMIFVFYSIDVLFLDKNKKVVEIKEDFKPFTFYTPKNKSKYIVELKQGKVKKSKTKVNDKLEF